MVHTKNGLWGALQTTFIHGLANINGDYRAIFKHWVDTRMPRFNIVRVIRH